MPELVTAMAREPLRGPAIRRDAKAQTVHLYGKTWQQSMSGSVAT